MAIGQRPRMEAIVSLGVAVLSAAQQIGAPTSTAQSVASNTATTASPSTPTTTDIPLELWSIASGLLTSYYPSTTLSGVSSLSWPDTVVIGGTTYNVQSLSDAIATSPVSTTPTSAISTTSTSPASTRQSAESTSSVPTGSAAKGNDNEHPHKSSVLPDKKLGIILGCVIGLVVLVLLSVLFWCLKRRKDDTGSFFARRGRSPSIASSQFRSWLPRGHDDTYGTTTYVAAGANTGMDKHQPQVSVRPQMAEPRRSQHPAFAPAFAPARLPDSSSRSTSEDNPFYTPAERMDAQLGDGAAGDLGRRPYSFEEDSRGAYTADLERGPYDPYPGQMDEDDYARPRSSHSMHAVEDRPATPFSPMGMMGFGAAKGGTIPRKPVPSQVDCRDFGNVNPAQGAANPFDSPDDEEADIVSPILPSRSPERRHSPTVHYPSWSEVSEFDFHGDGHQRLRNANSVDNTDGGDGWRPLHERANGRYELA